MSVIDTLITDRTSNDVETLELLRAKNWDAFTQAERDFWNGTGGTTPKGGYNYTDYNRVGSAVAYLKALYDQWAYVFVLPATPKTNWQDGDKPTATQLNNYLANVGAIRSWLAANDPATPLPALPSSMLTLTVDGANAIEEILVAAQDFIDRNVVFQSGMGVQSGMLWAQFS